VVCQRRDGIAVVIDVVPSSRLALSVETHAEPHRASARLWGHDHGQDVLDGIRVADEAVARMAVIQGLAPIRSMSVSMSMPTDWNAAAATRKSTG
jgi:hypothetical protein